MQFRPLLITALLTGASIGAQAQTIFTDDFNADLRGLNRTTYIGGWTVGNGTVDVIGAGPGNAPGAGPGQPGDATGYNFGFSQGNFIDLDGSNSDSGIFTKMLTLNGGTTYTASFQLAGSQRNFTESVNVEFGTTTAIYTYGNMMTFTTSVLTFTPSSTGSYALRFFEPSTSGSLGNLEGLLLDNVAVAAVPEPSAALMLLAGLAGAGFMSRRRVRRV